MGNKLIGGKAAANICAVFMDNPEPRGAKVIETESARCL